MSLVVVSFSTVIVASLATWAGVWLLARPGRLRWVALILVVSLLLDAALFLSDARQPAFTSILLLLICTGVGTLIGWWIEERYVLMIALPFAAISDLVSVLTPVGFTQQVVEDAAHGGKLLTYMTVSVPFQGRIFNVVGFADLMLLAVIILALKNMGARWLTAFAVPFTGSMTALAVALTVGAIPGIPFLAATTLVYLLLRPGDQLPD